MAKAVNTFIRLIVRTCVAVTLWYAIFHWLSIRRMSSYKMDILSQIAHSLNGDYHIW